ncbi:MAG: hypothetical protein ACQUHE_00670 [Bacteroidia bacterium]
MKFYIKLTLLFLFPICSFAQNQSDANTFSKSLDLAKKKEKLVLLIINPDYRPEMQSKVPTGLALLNDEVAKKAKENFVVFETKRTDTSIRNMISTYKVNRFPAFLFMHPSKDIFHVDFGYSTTKHKYIAMFDKALVLSKAKTVSALQDEYLKNPTDYVILRQLIELRKRNGVTDNAELIEKYVQGLKVSDFSNYETVLFILTSGPYSDGNAYKLAYTNRKITDSIYRTEPVQVRSAMNGAIISNTMANAIKTNNRVRATNAANMARNMSGRDYVRGHKIFNSQMLYFYELTKDTSNYFKLAVQHYDTYFMNLSADSIKKAELKERQTMLERMRPPAMHTNTVTKEKLDSIMKANPTARTVTRTESVVTSTPSSNYANELNNIAYRFYQKGTKNLNYLSKAMLWSKRAVELNPMWGYYDTLAHVYYAMGIYSEALATQKIAMDLAKKEGNPDYFTRASKAYDKMKNKSL